MEQRRREAAESLAKHSVFGFQIHDGDVASRVTELREMLLATCGEEDQTTLLSDQVREIEELLRAQRDARESFLLEPLRRFEQEMEVLLDVCSGDEVVTEEEEEEEEDETLSQEEETLTLSEAQAPSPSVIAEKKIEEEEEVLCGVCCAPDSPENDPIVICELCGVAVHQTCYRLAALPDGDWYCHPCKRYIEVQDVGKNLIPTHELECEACNTKAGAFAPSGDGGWVHVACSMFLPELYMQDKHASRFQGRLDDLQVVCGVEKLRARRRLRCCFCRKSNDKGACAQCAVGKCTVAYHALCALRHGIKIRYMEDQGQFGSGCLRHQSQFLKMDSLNGGESEEDQSSANDRTKAPGNKQRAKKPQKNSWSDEDETESDDEDGNALDSDSEHENSDDSISDEERSTKDIQATPTTSTKESPPRLLGGPRMRKGNHNRTNRQKRSRQVTLSFETAKPAAQIISSSNPTITPEVVAAIGQNTTRPTSTRHNGLTASRRHADSDSQAILQSNVFIPALFSSGYDPDDSNERDYEYVMVLISTRPLGLGVVSANGPRVRCMFLQAKATNNQAVLSALKRGVIQDGDEMFALNSQVLRNTDFESFKQLASTSELPVRCWFRTKRKSFKRPGVYSAVASVNTNDALEGVATISADSTVSTLASPSRLGTPDIPTSNLLTGDQPRKDNDAIVSLGIDWPWLFLRSDGKLAMNLFWRSLDTAFFVRKFNKRKFAQLQKEVEDICGVRLSSSHPEYSQVRELLVMPRRERVPAYLVEFRKTRKQKQTFLSSDIFMGVTSETNNAEVEVDEQNALAVGTTVTVAKRTWPGMNKLGGAGRIQKVNEEILPEGTVRFTYNVRYVLGGSEKNVERKYISVVDLDSEDTEKIEESSTVGAGGRAKTGPNVEAIDDTEQDTLSVRLLYEVERTTEEEKLLALSKSALERPPKRRRFQLQFTTENATVFCERILNPRAVDLQQLGSSTPTKELLLHRHFDVKVPDGEAMINECFSSKLLTIEDRAGDEVDEDDSESEDGEDEIKTELTTLQEQFRAVMASNEKMFDALTKKVEGEHFSKSYRHRELQDIRWRNYERMYLELQTAKRQFDDSDNEDEHLNENGRVPSSAGANAVSEGDNESENEDDSCGGLFVNKIKQEGNEVCGLCELSGGDFAATDSGSVVHPQCAMFTPETFFKDGIVHGIDKVAPERRRLVCNICGGRKGLSKIQCANRKCTLAYHVACAYVNGRLTRDPYYQAWCPRHLKSSGMAHFVEIPEHLNKQRGMNDNTGTHEQSNSPARRGRKPNKERKSNQKKKHHDTTPAEATTSVPGGISSSKTSRKRKRKNSGGSGSNMKSSHGGSPGRAIVIGDQEPSCARRLDIDELDDDSDHEGKAVEQWQQGRDVRRVFNKNDVVEVLARDWRGINKPGGVGRVRVVNVESNETGGKDVFYDVNYVVSGGKEKHVAARFVRSYDQSSAA